MNDRLAAQHWPGSALLRRVVGRRRAMLALHALLVLAAAPGVFLIETDNSPRVFFVHDDAVLQRYERFQLFFGRDRSLRVMAQGEGLWTRPGLDWLTDLEKQTGRWTGVVGAVGLYASHRWDFPEWPPDPKRLRQTAVADPLDRNMGWIDAEGRTVTTLLVLSRLSPERQNRLLQRLEAYLEGAPAGVRVGLAGLPEINRAFDQEVERWVGRFFPLLILLAVAMLAAAFRRPADVLAPLLLVGVCQTVVFGAMGYAGVRLNLILVLLAPLLFVISLATSVHILVRYRQLSEAGTTALQATLAAYRDKAWPTFWTGATTAAGFGSLAVAEVPPIRQFGVWAAVGMIFVTAACFTFYPALLASIGGAARPLGAGFCDGAGRLGFRWASLAVRRRGRVIACFTLGAAIMLAGVWRLSLDSNALHYLEPEQPARRNLEKLQEVGIAGVAAEISLEAGPGLNLESPEGLDRLSRLSSSLRGLPLTLGVVGPADIVAAAVRNVPAQTFTGETRVREAVRRMRENPETSPLLGAALTRGGAAARVTLLVAMRGYDDLQPVFEEALKRSREMFPDATVYLTGQYTLVLDAQRSLLRTMLFSLALTLLAVGSVFWALTRALTLTLRVLLPNLWPVAFVLGGLGWVGFPLDSTTVMIASVALGLAVDDTLHALGAFRRRHALPPGQAAVEALRETAPGQILTTLVLSAGFAVCGLSQFVPVSRFGVMTASALVAALVADLWLTPALLAGWRRREG